MMITRKPIMKPKKRNKVGRPPKHRSVGRPRKTKLVPQCPYYNRLSNKSSDYCGIICRANEFTIGFSSYLDKMWLSNRTFNYFYINTYTGGNVKHARDSYVKNNCNGNYKKCKFFRKYELKKARETEKIKDF